MAGSSQSKFDHRVWQPTEVLFHTFIRRSTKGGLLFYVHNNAVYSFLNPDQLRPDLPLLVVSNLCFSVATVLPPEQFHRVTDQSFSDRVLNQWRLWLSRNDQIAINSRSIPTTELR